MTEGWMVRMDRDQKAHYIATDGNSRYYESFCGRCKGRLSYHNYIVVPMKPPGCCEECLAAYKALKDL